VKDSGRRFFRTLYRGDHTFRLAARPTVSGHEQALGSITAALSRNDWLVVSKPWPFSTTRSGASQDDVEPSNHSGYSGLVLRSLTVRAFLQKVSNCSNDHSFSDRTSSDRLEKPSRPCGHSRFRIVLGPHAFCRATSAAPMTRGTVAAVLLQQ
jgi:hypothetical protein